MNLTRAIEICRELEPIFAGFGHHVGLTGGCLYKDGERKDADLIVYPHQAKDVSSVDTLLDVIEARTALRFVRVGTGVTSGYDLKAVRVMDYNGERIDLFFLK